MTRRYKGTLSEMESTVATIDNNLNLPNNKGTSTWAVPELASDGDYIVKVPYKGWGGFSYEEATEGVTAEEVEVVDSE
ncbi:MAG: hypothetical protein Unbinned5081contig1002_41 [Prokaryotic dsDNA virus sp.]|nr:MAG: hypothetical protein Unbinned5081contig1002_41 [Prokaryotic dsDNA virus sp.]|tara:strand:+ start:27720 stop:27953 length:234 start_codon:yes stop_codon:yes gene_type:complete